MKHYHRRSLKHNIQSLSLILVLSTAILGMTSTLAFALYMEYQNLNRNLMNSAMVLAQSPDVADLLSGHSDRQVITQYLDGTISRVQDIDAIVVANLEGTILYSPDPTLVGSTYPALDSLAVLHGQDSTVDTGAGISGVEHRAQAIVHGPDGSPLGFVSVGIGVRSIRWTVVTTVAIFLALAAVTATIALILSRHLSSSIKDSLMGYEPDAFNRLFHQREGILDTLEEGILAIDTDARIVYMNRAGLHMMGADNLRQVLGKPLSQIYPNSLLPRLLTTGKAEYNIHLTRVPGLRSAISDRMPIWEDGQIVGAVAIFRDRSEATSLAEELTGARHLVEAMRAYTHEFINKLHVILGMLQLGQPEQAEQYILEVSQAHHQSVSRVMNQIQDVAVAALLVGKTSRAAELHIQLQLDPKSSLSAGERFLPSGVMVTILGNLIENATESLNRSAWKQREITVSIREKEDSLFLCVEDTGPGILPELLPYIFEPNVSTKGTGHGVGLTRIRELVNLYHGQIRVESEPKSGTSFFLSFHASPQNPPS